MQIAALGMTHESNTFAPVSATIGRFMEAGVLEGASIVDTYGDSQTTMAGYLDLSSRIPAATVVPLIHARLTPMGTITASAFELLSDRLLHALEAHGPWDAVLLSLHGAAVSAQHHDADGEILRRVRGLVGPDVPIGASMDMHANLSKMMIGNADVANLYLTNPHLDPRPRGLEVAELVYRTARGDIAPTMALEQLPIAPNILRQGTDDHPMRYIMAAAADLAARPGVLSVSVAEGFPYADVEEMGMSVLVVTDDDETGAREVARHLGCVIWDERGELVGDAWDVDAALQHASRSTRRPVVLLDVGDNVGGGSPGDSTHVLARAQAMQVPGLFQSVCDPESVQSCGRAGAGATVELDVGGKTDDLHGSSVHVRGTVTCLSDGRFEDPAPTHGGVRFFDTGPGAVVHTTDDHTLLLTSRPLGNTSLEQLRSVGITPEDQPIIVAKGVHSPRGAYEPIAAEMLWLNSPGCTTADLEGLPYRRRRRPMFPWELDTTY